MKHIVILIDGAADYPDMQNGGMTPLSAAHKPNIDFLAQNGEARLIRTVPDGMAPGSDVANLSVMGYDPKKYYTGRSPLEGVSIGVELTDTDTTFRANIVTLSDEDNYEDKTMVDYSSGEITTAESTVLINDLNDYIKTELYDLHPGVSYRHLLKWRELLPEARLTPPHDISGRCVRDYLPDRPEILNIMKKSYDFLSKHPVNADRIKRGLNPANSLWIWGQGTKPALPDFNSRFGKKACMISAVDLLKGIAICAGMKSIDVEGTTGTIDTNFDGKAQAAVSALKAGYDFVYIHLEAPDECGHHFDKAGKIKSLELIDEKIVAPILKYLQSCGEDFAFLVTPDHATPVSIGTHTNDKIPYIIYKSNKTCKGVSCYCEEKITEEAPFAGCELMDYFIRG